MTRQISLNEYDSMTPSPGGPSAPAAHPEAEAETEGRYRDRLRASLLIGLCCLIIYNANLRAISAGDTYPARYLPFAILQHHTIFLDPIARVAAQGRGDTAFWMPHRPDGHFISLYPVVVPLLVAPLYVPAVGYLHLRGWTDARLDHVARVMEKLAASFLAALSASLLYLLLRRRAKASIALLLTLAYAFGTTTWVVSSQALWQHGLAEVLVIGALLLLTGPSTAPRALAAGLLLGLLAGNRPPDVILAAALGAYGLFWAGRRRATLLAAAAALPMVLVLLYNLAVAGNVGGGYGLIGRADFFKHDLVPGVAGLLVSPTRGLLVFSPFLLFLGLAWRHLPRGREERGLTLAMCAGIAIQILLYAKADWRGGLSWGPRYMTDLLPLLIWMLVPVAAPLRGFGRVLFLIAVGVSVAIEAIGAFSYAGSIDTPIFAADRGPQGHDMRAAWHWRNAPFITSLQRGLAPAELATVMRGSFDAIESGGRATSAVTAGQEAIAAGWALAGSTTPWQVAVIIDGRQPFASQTFSDRPDVRGTLHAASPAGWRIPIDTAGLAPGEHSLTAFAWASAKGEGYLLEERKLLVWGATAGASVAPSAEVRPETAGQGVLSAEPDLNESFRKAAARLREHQQAAGYWLTAYTSETRFREPRPEMNTFLTALLIDLLDPLAADSGLEDTLQRARRHLTSQIESGGLVRYHGRPDGPGIGTLGCAITPDTDNTALTWRLAPAPDRERLTAALATIDRYRTGQGLYRTWLAPRDAYQCLDPGRDPNPADIAIQMHLLLLLSEVRPESGHALCEALRPLVDEDRVWVYYRKTPLVPILRLPDLRRAGCALELPEARMRTDVPDQQIWVSVVRMLGGTVPPKGSPPDAVLLRAVLRELARDDFALIRMNPPLLYHNDVTATVSRYYWSEDAGYALWLRLYDEYAHRGGSHRNG
ncbi:MAG: hypothetical protein JWO56_2298 [Acidobacteria bacterium]|nr:hypothetical protein [Acidobacteriota bacterium]